MNNGETIRCMRCAHHFITYDPHFPYGCRALDFKSRRLPQHEVVGASLRPCQFYAAKSGKTTKEHE